MLDAGNRVIMRKCGYSNTFNKSLAKKLVLMTAHHFNIKPPFYVFTYCSDPLPISVVSVPFLIFSFLSP